VINRNSVLERLNHSKTVIKVIFRHSINDTYLTVRKIIGVALICKPAGWIFLEKFSIYENGFVISKNA